MPNQRLKGTRQKARAPSTATVAAKFVAAYDQNHFFLSDHELSDPTAQNRELPLRLELRILTRGAAESAHQGRQAALPQVSRIGVLYNPVNPASRVALEEWRASARTLAVELQVQEIRQPNELAHAFSVLRARRAGAVLVVSDSVFAPVSELAKLAVQSRLPAIHASRLFPEAGGLFGYGPSFTEDSRRAASYVDKILKGATPADLPVQRPTNIEFVINMTAAKTLGLNVPQPLLLRADAVIE